MATVTYRYVRNLLDLDEREEKLDRLILCAAQACIERHLGRGLRLCERVCVQAVQGGKILLDALNPTEILSVRGVADGGEIAGGFALHDGAVWLGDRSLEGRMLRVAFKAGYTARTLPADLRECVVLAFLHKSEQVRRTAEGRLSAGDYRTLTADDLPRLRGTAARRLAQNASQAFCPRRRGRSLRVQNAGSHTGESGFDGCGH